MADVITENFKISLQILRSNQQENWTLQRRRDLIEIRFFHSQVHKGFRVWILDH